VVGFAAGEIPALPWNLPLLKSASIVGVFWGYLWRNQSEINRVNVAQLIEWMSEGKLQVSITEIMDVKQGIQALKLLENRKVKGKIVLKVNE
jgi:NADPH2:quinone reductase